MMLYGWYSDHIQCIAIPLSTTLRQHFDPAHSTHQQTCKVQYTIISNQQVRI